MSKKRLCIFFLLVTAIAFLTLRFYIDKNQVNERTTNSILVYEKRDSGAEAA